MLLQAKQEDEKHKRYVEQECEAKRLTDAAESAKILAELQPSPADEEARIQAEVEGYDAAVIEGIMDELGLTFAEALKQARKDRAALIKAKHDERKAKEAEQHKKIIDRAASLAKQSRKYQTNAQDYLLLNSLLSWIVRSKSRQRLMLVSFLLTMQ